MLTPVLLIILAVVCFVVFVSRQPTHFHIVRSIMVTAPASAVFPHVNDFRKWEAWSPWEKVDPKTKKIYSGAPSGVGANYAWVGNAKVGAGHMTIVESHPCDLIRITIEFTKPMKAKNHIEFTFIQSGDQTVVTHGMTGCNSFLGKLMSLFCNMDTMIGGQFEKGLASIKEIAERG